MKPRPWRATRHSLLALLLLLGAALGGVRPACALDNVTLQLKWTHNFQFAGYYAAKEQGYYRAAGLEVRIAEATPGSDPVGKVLSGQSEFGVGTSSLLLLRHAGQPVVVLGVIFQHSPYILATSRHEPTQSIHDLAGKRVMLEPQAEELLALLKKEGITPERISRIEHSFDPQDLINGKVDAISAYVINQPYYFDRAGFAYQAYSPRSAGIDFYGDNLFTTERELQRHPQRVRAFREASLRGWAYAMSHPDEIADLIRAKYSQEHSRDYLLFQARQMQQLIHPELIEIGYMYPGRWSHIAETYADLGMLPKDFPLAGFLYETEAPRDQTWLYRTLAIALLIIVFSSAVAYRLSRLSRALRSSEERFRLVADNAQDVLWKYDLARQRLSYVSPSIERLSGYTVEEAMALSAAPSSALAAARAVREAVAYLEARPEATKSVMEFESTRKDGSTVWAEDTMSIIRDAHGQPAEVVGISRDITARRQAQEQQKRFLAMISHEFRTPMNAILGMAELLADTGLTPEQRKYVEVFQNAGNSLLELINDILDLSKAEAGQFQLDKEDFALTQVLHEQIELLSQRARDKGLALSLDIAPDVPPFVHGDAQRLKQCITNLVGNALKFCNHGSIAVAVRPLPDIQDMLHFSVTDSGIGIPADKLDTIFEAFTQADSKVTRNFGGTGLGLAITQRFVELMEGRIWVESTPGKGSTFHFTARLPRTLQPMAQTKPPAITHGAIPPLAILLAEDNPNNVFLTQALLKDTPCRIDVADNGATAVEKFRAGRYDLVLMDLEMPIMDGYTATREIRAIEQREQRRATPVVALTAHALKEHEQASRDAGCDGHLAKPLRKRVLLELLASLSAAGSDGAGIEPPAAAQTLPPVVMTAAQRTLDALPRNGEIDIQAALARLEIEPELYLEILGLFRDALPAYRAELPKALAAGDIPETRRQSHSLKGEAATVGAEQLSAAAAAFETALLRGEAQNYPSLLKEVERLIDAASQFLLNLPRQSN